MMKRTLLAIGIACCSVEASAQNTKSTLTPAIKDSGNDVPVSSIISRLPIRNVGPDTQGEGYSFSAFAVYEADPNIFYFSSPNGGVMKTTDGGRSSLFVFDRIGSSSIGSIAVSQKDPNLVWVGTGDRWQRNSVGMGDGIYKSEDGGRTWACMGLKKSVSIGRIAMDPKDNNILIVAVMGSPWGYGPDRGIYKTTDGGRTWKKVLFVDERTAGTDVFIDPKNPSNIVASMWEHIHRPWGYFSTGPGSGIFRSTDGGETWHRVSKGLPKNPMGRIALDYFRPNPQEVVAAIEAAYPATGIYRSNDGGETWEEMPAIHHDENGKIQDEKDQRYWYRPYNNQVIRFSSKDVNTIYHGNIWHVSKDGGRTWRGGTDDQHELWNDPKNPDHFLQSGDLNLKQHWITSNSMMSDFVKFPSSLFQTYGCGYDMRKLYWVMGNAQDAVHAFMVPTQSVFGSVSYEDIVAKTGMEAGSSMADPEDWTTVYSRTGGTVCRTDLKTGIVKENSGVSGENYDLNESYKEYEKSKVKRRVPPREAPSFEISPWDSKTIYYGTNFLYKSIDRGDHWQAISPDLSHNKPEWQIHRQSVYRESDAIASYQTIVSICESPLRRDMIWVGTDDGCVQLTLDGGKTWQNLSKNIPDVPDTSWVSRIYASHHKEGRAYITFDNHRNFDLRPLVFVTEDYGNTWTKISNNLPDCQPCRVIQEGLKNPDLLFVGTEFGLWISLDRGKSWTRYQEYNFQRGKYKGYFPSVAVNDLHIHPRELDLIVGAYGRGIWILPVRALEELTSNNFKKDVVFTTPGHVYLFPKFSRHNEYLDVFFHGSSDNTQPGTLLNYYLKKDAEKDEAFVTISDPSGQMIYAKTFGQAKKGLNTIPLTPDWTREKIKKPGDYRVVLTIDGKEYYQTLHVEDATNEVLAGLAISKRFNENTKANIAKKRKGKEKQDVAD